MVRTAILGATVIDGTGQPPIPDAVVLIEGERIVNVGRAGDFALEPDVEAVDARGTWVIPGLIEAHAHVGILPDNSFLQVDDPAALTETFMREFVRHGVTTIRDTGNFDPDAVLALLRAGRPEWPRFFGAGPILDGSADPPAPWRWLTIVDDPATASREAQRLINTGVDFLKVYVWATAPVLEAIVRTAHASGVRVAAHVGHVLTVEQAVRIGVDALEHVRVGRELLDPEGLARLAALPTRVLDPLVSWRPWRFVDLSSDRVSRLIELLAERDVVLTPTLCLPRAILLGRDPSVTEPPAIEVLPEPVRAQWRQYAYPFDYSEEDWANAKVELERQMAFVGRAQAGGVKVACGTDTPNPFVIPGISMHDELELLVACGFSTREALMAATYRGAHLLGRASQIGSVRKGRFADLVVLHRDPLADIRNSRAIRAVLKVGRIVHGSLAPASAGG